MRILLASSSSGSRGGGELYLIYLARALVQRGHSVTLWASTHPRMDELANTFASFGEVIRSRYDNTYDRRGRSLAGHFHYWASARAALEWRQARVDLVHVNKQNLEDGTELLRAARWSRLPSLCTIHLTQSAKYLGAKFAGIRDWTARRALRTYRGLIVAVLENRRSDLLQFLGPTPKVRLVQNGVPLFDLTQREALRSNKRAELMLGRDHLLFLGVGRMVPQKRPLLFLERAERIRRTFPQARFLWVGDGPLAGAWDAEVARRGLGEFVQRLTWQMDIQPFLFAADLRQPALCHYAQPARRDAILQ
jgi:glycosyltransferase involved in cell wall biosynthesis